MQHGISIQGYHVYSTVWEVAIREELAYKKVSRDA